LLCIFAVGNVLELFDDLCVYMEAGNCVVYD